MKHKIKLFIFIAICTSFQVRGQGSISLEDKPFIIKVELNKQLLRWLDSNRVYLQLSDNERDMAYWLNEMRQDPKAFWDNYVTSFLEQYPHAKGDNANSLKRDLYAAGALQKLAPNSILMNTAKAHCEDLAQRQKYLSHESSDGKSFEKRMREAGITRCAGENIYEGKKETLRALIILLIDEHVPGVGHRKALLNPSFNQFGSAFSAKGDKYILVQDFSCLP